MNKKTIFFGIGIIVVVALAVWAGILIADMKSGAVNPDGPSRYSAVYLTSGDIYFGKLNWFPSPHMTDVWFVERNQGQGGQAQLGLAPMKSVFWGPVDEINFNAQDILFWTRLANNSQVVQSIEAQANGQPVSMPGGGAAPSLPSGASATSTK